MTSFAAGSRTWNFRHGRWARNLRDFVTRLTWSLPLREPSPVDSSKTAAPARGANGRYYARDLQGLRAGRDRRDPGRA